MARSRVIAIGVLFVSLLLTGCQAQPPRVLTEQQVVGTWISEAGATVVIQASGRFEAVDIPGDVIEYRQNLRPVDLEGDWNVSEERFQGTPYLELHSDDLDLSDPYAGTKLLFLSRVVADDLVLFFVIGDPDSRIWLEFTRENG